MVTSERHAIPLEDKDSHGTLVSSQFLVLICSNGHNTNTSILQQLGSYSQNLELHMLFKVCIAKTISHNKKNLPSLLLESTLYSAVTNGIAKGNNDVSDITYPTREGF